MEKVYQILSYLHLDEDATQEIAIKVWEARESYNPEAGALSTWVTSIAKNHLISIRRSLQHKKENATNPLSHYDVEFDDGAIHSLVDSYLTSKELSPLDGMIYQEEKEELTERLRMLRDSDKQLVEAYFREESLCSNDRVKLHRLKESIIEGKKWRYQLENVATGEKFFIDRYAEASEITGIGEAAIGIAAKDGRLFGKKMWQIIYLTKN